MKHKFEEYFQLPWSIKRRTVCWEMGVEENFVYLDLNGDGSEHASEKIPSLIDFTARRDNVDFDKYDVDNAREDALKYLVQCANLMPECVNILKEADMYMTSMFVGLCNDCPDKGTEMCRVCKLKTVLDDIETLLAKLEGGADDA